MINLYNFLFLDTETVPVKEEFSDLSETQQQLFNDKTAYQRKDGEATASFYHKAAIWAEHWHSSTKQNLVSYLAIYGEGNTIWTEKLDKEYYDNIKIEPDVSKY